MTVHDFTESLEVGRDGERHVAELLRRWYDVRHVDGHTDSQWGIDLLCIRPDGTEATVQVKTDVRAGDTGNVFIEIESVRGVKTSGIATSAADVVAYYLPHIPAVWLFDRATLWSYANEWADQYRLIDVANDGWTTTGVAVPLHVAKRAAIGVVA